MQRKIKVIQHGIGAKGKIMVNTMLNKAGVELVGAVDIENVGKDLGEVLGLDKKLGIIISDDLDSVLSQTKPDVMLDATLPYLKQLFPIFIKALEAKVNIISIGAGVFNPWISEPEFAGKLDEIANRNGVSVVGTGMRPGFGLTVLPLLFTGVCGHVSKITCSSITDLSRSGPAYRRRCGFGLSKDEAESKLAKGEVKLYFAYPDEAHFIANCLGWKLSDVREEKEFLISKNVRDHLPDYKIEPGQVCGYRHDCFGLKGDKVVLEIRSTVSIDPSLDGLEVCNTVAIEGKPSFTIDATDMTLGKNVPMIVASIAVNWIPHIMKAKPGLMTSAKDYPLVTCLPSLE